MPLRTVASAKFKLQHSTCRSVRPLPAATFRSESVPVWAFAQSTFPHASVFRQKAEFAFAGETVLRGVSVTFEELAVMHATGLTQDQLHTARVFSIADANFLRAEATGAAWCSVMLARSPKSARAVVARAAAIALSAGLRKSYQLEEDPSLDVDAYVDEVALAAARAMTAGKSEAEAEADSIARFEEIYWAPSEVRQFACAAAALMGTCDESMRAAFSELIAPYSLASVEAGRKCTAHIALRAGPREHAWTAQWDLEYHARDLFGGSTEYADVMSMVGAFRQAYGIVYKPKPMPLTVPEPRPVCFPI